jgi:hypothetical protein
MAKRASVCPECGDKVPAEPKGRRDFLKTLGAGAAALALAKVPAWSQDAGATSEALIKELYGSLTEDQKKLVVAPFDDPGRLKIYNAALGKKIGEAYTKPQQELVQRILRSLASDEKGWEQLSRKGTWDASKAFENCGANLFGDLSGNYTWVFSGHHLTIRCDGDSVEGPALGGPLYYGHTPNGYSSNNVFSYQTESAMAAYEGLSAAQRKQATLTGTPGEGAPSIAFRPAGEARPGISLAELDAAQKGLVEKVMRDLLSPYRKADAEETLKVVKEKGGFEKLSMAFYLDPEKAEKPDARRPWHFWRIEGAGFVWNFRVLPHVHTFVNVSAKA